MTTKALEARPCPTCGMPLDPDDPVFGLNLDAIYQGIDALLRAGQFAVVDAALSGVPVETNGIIENLAYVSITSAAKHALPRWPFFVDRVRRRIRELDPERVDELMAGFHDGGT